MFPLITRKMRVREKCAALASILAVLVVSWGVEASEGGRTKSVVVDTPFEITVKANPTTGFEWVADYDKEFLSLKSKTYLRDASKPKDWVGVGGHATLVFVPLKTGRTRLRLLYKRPWEPYASQEATYWVTIRPR
ncbi:MAG: protease inhibitor I42 family protein [Desulfomonilaceae bacterium]|nr:protease inhibitor I42 family protein [Desulfomonilaceae bacterium]